MAQQSKPLVKIQEETSDPASRREAVGGPEPGGLLGPSLQTPEVLTRRVMGSALEGLAESTPALRDWLDEIERIKEARGKKLTAGELLNLVRTHAAIQKELRDTLTAGALIAKLAEVSNPPPIRIVLPDRVADALDVIEEEEGSMRPGAN